MRDPRLSGESGMTLLELLTTMMIFGIIAAFAVMGLRVFSRSLAEQGTQREVVSLLRDVQVKAVAEDTTYCVDFGSRTSTTSWTVYKTPGADQGSVATSCSGFANATLYEGPIHPQSGVSVTNVDFNQRDGSDSAFVLFYPRGAATSGSFTVVRTGSTTAYTVNVEGLTARVSSSGS